MMLVVLSTLEMSSVCSLLKLKGNIEIWASKTVIGAHFCVVIFELKCYQPPPPPNFQSVTLKPENGPEDRATFILLPLIGRKTNSLRHSFNSNSQVDISTVRDC